MQHAHIKAILEGVIPEMKAAIAAAQKPLLDRIALLESRSPEKGEKGEPGRDGASITVEDVAPLIETAVVKAVSALPAPKDGEPGAPGEKGEPGRDGRDASDIPILKGFITDEVRTSTRDTLKSFSLRTSDEGRTLIFAADVAGEFVESEIKTALPLDCGVWREREYKKGDGASLGGSFFIAQEDTSDKPETSKAWRLAVKRGRDGRDGKPGERGLPGLKGDRGEPGPRGFGG